MVRPLSLALLTAASAALLGLLLLPGALSTETTAGRAGAALFAVLVTLVPVALIALGAVRGGGGLGRLGAALAALALLLAGSAAGVVLLSGWLEPSVLGLPPATVLALAGLWLLPLPLVALAYALTFDRTGVSRADLEALRERTGRRTRQRDDPPPPGPARTEAG